MGRFWGEKKKEEDEKTNPIKKEPEKSLTREPFKLIEKGSEKSKRLEKITIKSKVRLVSNPSETKDLPPKAKIAAVKEVTSNQEKILKFRGHSQLGESSPKMDEEGTHLELGPIAQVLIDKGYLRVEQAGVGNYATVFRVQTQSRKEMAIKVIELDKVSKNYRLRFLPRELEIISKLKHKNIVQVFSIQTTHMFVFIFMEYAPNGTLGDYLRRNSAMPEWMACHMFGQIIEALHYMHRSGIAHRDLKLENILLDKHFVPKLTDFSYSLVCAKGSKGYVLSKTFCGSLPYMAPEILQRKFYDPKAGDVWSFGVCLFIVLNDKLPFKLNDLATLIKSQLAKEWDFKPRIKLALTPEGKDLVAKMLEPDPKLRINSTDILLHNWFKVKLK